MNPFEAHPTISMIFVIGFVILGIVGALYVGKKEECETFTISMMVFCGIATGAFLGYIWCVTVGIGIIGAVCYSIVKGYDVAKMFYDKLKDKQSSQPLQTPDYPKQLQAIRDTNHALEIFKKINQLKQSKFSKGMLLEQYEKELEQIILVISNGEMYSDYGEASSGGMYRTYYSNYTVKMKIPDASKSKFIEVVQEFKVLVDHAETEIKRLEKDEQDRIDNCNNKALDDIHQLLVAIKKDKIGE